MLQFSPFWTGYTTVAMTVRIFLSAHDARNCLENIFFMLAMQDSHVIPAVSTQIFGKR